MTNIEIFRALCMACIAGLFPAIALEEYIIAALLAGGMVMFGVIWAALTDFANHQ